MYQTIKRTLAAATILLWTTAITAQTVYEPSATKYDWSELSRSIAGDKTEKYDQAYAIYRWLCDNIAYDTTYSIHDADTAYEQRRGVCQAYSEMFYRLAEPLGLQVEVIVGKAKDSDGVIDPQGHAWVFAYTNGNSGILIDPTWGAGSVNDGRFTHSKKDDSWFHVDPRWMIFSHFPDMEANQLLPEPIDFDTFSRLPSYRPALGSFGFKSADLLNRTLSGEKPDLPKFYEGELANVEIGALPKSGTLRVGRSYGFIIKPLGNYEFSIHNGKDWDTDWQPTQGYLGTRVIPSEGGTLTVGYRQKGTSESWSVIAKYVIADPTVDDIAALEKAAPIKAPALTSLPNFNADQLARRRVDPAALLSAVKDQGIKKLPKFYSAGDFSINDIPLNGQLKVGKTYRFAFSPYESGEWVIVNGDDWHTEWSQDEASRAWVMTVTPTTPGELILSHKPDNSTGNSYSYCIEYEVLN